MSNLHSQQTDPQIHDPKNFAAAQKGFKAWKNERNLWVFEAAQTLPTALAIVNNTVSPPTSNDGDIYILDNTGTSHSGWNGAAANSWVRFRASDGVWVSITPTLGVKCYSAAALGTFEYNGTAWVSVGGGGGGSTTFTGLTDTPTNYTGAGNRFVRVNSGATALEFVSASSIGLSVFNNDAGFVTADTNLANTNLTLTANRNHALTGFTLGFTGGDVGFGTASPTARLHIAGSNDLSGTYAAKIGGATTTGLWVQNDGKVGINTTSIAYQLDVVGSTRSTDFYVGAGANVSRLRRHGYYFEIVDATYPYLGFSTTGSAGYSDISLGPGKTAYSGASNTTDMGFRLVNTGGSFYWGISATGSTYDMRLSTTGLSIGNTVTPTARLHVVGSNDLSGTYAAKIGGATTTGLQVSNIGSVIVGSAAIATNATDGFLYISTCAGTPTGVPTTFGSTAPMVIDSTNNKLYIYSGGTWVALN